MQVIVDGLLTSYERTGKGRQMLILEGWADSASNWQSFAGALTDDYEIIVPDLPGFGGSQAPNEPWGLDEYAAFVAAFIKKLKLQPYVLVGHSNGGAIAIRALAKKQLTAEKLVLLASAGIRTEYKGRNKALRLVTKAGKVLTSALPVSTKRKLRRKVYKTVGSDMLVAEHLQETFKKVVTDDVQQDAARLSQPTLLIYGEQDKQTPLRYGELLHEKMSNSTLEILPGADHFLYRSHQAAIIKLIKDFLR